MLPIADPVFYLCAIPAVLIIGISKGGLGGGAALIGVPLLSLAIPPLQAAGILLPILLVMDAVGLISFRGTYDKRTLIMLIPAGLAGVFIGWMTASYVSESHVRLIVGIISLMFVLNYWLGGRKKTEPAPHNTLKGLFWGTLSGFTSFVSHAGGAPYQMYTLPLRLSPVLYAGTAIIFFSTINFSKVLPYFLLGQFDATNLSTSLVLLPLAAIATYAGVHLVRIINVTLYYRITYFVVFLVALKLIYDGLTA
ncbi:sulfite exporter TauE/SafE family protein [Rhodobacteraceae bacterium RKSG542]|uniref:sulfite exporter TauE/SafE family protein n=1 Tax=Pseudovibrio flavus TaxID=2529854 RepID=UPI0012BC69CA|nr:sulfite exporter TauE/SafE family protein [Pseudovibrio flavus]MTI16570.1 sulfite exporter TauE/SafE family protein [Pseudovibrio flavus]